MTDGGNLRPVVPPAEDGGASSANDAATQPGSSATSPGPRLRLSRREVERALADLADDVARDYGDDDEPPADTPVDWERLKWL